jgi:MFS family permease
MPARVPEPERLWSRDFVLLFLLLVCANCCMAVFYCFEQWLDRIAVSPNWRGILLGAMFAAVLVARPFASVLLLKRSKLAAMVLSILATSGVMLAYMLLPSASPWFVWMALGLRVIQGLFLALFSSCTVALMVTCFPKGQSAKGFAIFSLTALLPYALMPSAGEYLLPLVGSEACLFALTGLLGLPALWMTALLAPRLRVPEVSTEAVREGKGVRHILACVRSSGLGLAFLALLLSGLTVSTHIFFMKGLCSVTGEDPAQFFYVYTTVMIVIRLAGSARIDGLPRCRVVPVCALLMATGLLAITWGPSWAYVPSTVLYGASLSLLYPLLASVIYERSSPEARSVNSNIMMLMFDAGGILAPVFGGLVINCGFGYRGVVTAAAGMITACGLSCLADCLLYARRMRRGAKTRAQS